MSPGQHRDYLLSYGFPRVSGDEPLAHGVQIDGNKFSPRERG